METYICALIDRVSLESTSWSFK